MTYLTGADGRLLTGQTDGELLTGTNTATALGENSLVSYDWSQTVLSQYANSPTLMAMIGDFATYLDQSVNINSFYTMIWDLDTAQGYGLDVWGRIVGVNRVLQIAATKYLGFEEATIASADPFNVSPLYSGADATSNYALSDTAYRLLIGAKALANISDGSISSINTILMLLFPGRGNAYVHDNVNMTMTYVFSFQLTAVEQAVVIQSGVLPRPAGVAVAVQFNSPTAPLDVFQLDVNALA